MKLEGTQLLNILKTCLSSLDSEDNKNLIKYLSETRPLAPRLMSMIVKTTPEARAHAVANRLQKTRTIGTAAQAERDQDIYNIIALAELNHIKGVIWNIYRERTGTVRWNPNKCSMTHAQDLRKASWGCELIGLDYVPPQEFIYLENTSMLHECHELEDDPNSTEYEKGFIGVKVARSLTAEELKNPLFKGPFSAYRGSRTKQKTVGYGDKLAVASDPLMSGLLRLFPLIGWAFPKEGNVSELIQQFKGVDT